MKKSILTLTVSLLCLSIQFSNAQTISDKKPKLPVYAEVGLGWGQALFFGDMRAQLIRSYGGAFEPGIGNNLTRNMQ